MIKKKTYKIIFSILIILKIMDIMLKIFKNTISPSIIFIKSSELLLLLSFLFYFIENNKIFIAGFYFLIFSIPGIIINNLGKIEISSIILLAAAIYMLFDYFKYIKTFEHKPIIFILSTIYPHKWIYKYELAKIEHKNRKYEKATKLIYKSYKQGLSEYHYKRRYGLILFDEKKYEKAIQYLKEAYNIDNSDSELLYFLGYAYNSIEKYNDAIQMYTDYLEKEKNNIDALHDRALSYSRIGEHKKAIKDYSMILEKDTDRADIYYNRGSEYDEINENEKAIKDWKKAVEMNNPDPKAFIVLAKIEHDKGNKEKAKELYLKALKLDQTLKDYVFDEYIE